MSVLPELLVITEKIAQFASSLGLDQCKQCMLKLLDYMIYQGHVSSLIQPELHLDLRYKGGSIIIPFWHAVVR